MCGVAAETNDLALIPRCFVYHSVVLGIDFDCKNQMIQRFDDRGMC
jgi:hypothetical protein